MNIVGTISAHESGVAKEKKSTTPMQVSGPFLLSFDHQDPTESEIADRAAEYFSFLWEPTTDTFSATVAALAKLVRLPKTAAAPGKRFRVPNLSLPPHAKFPYVTSRLLSLELSSEFANGISLPSLLRHYCTNARPAAPRETVSLENCFGFFSHPEALDEQNQWLCPACRALVCANKEMQVWSVPECLIVHFKRFTVVKKISAIVEFPRVLDMARYVVGPQRGEKLEYALYGVSEHTGSLHLGHYTAHALVQRGDAPGKWYAFNDASVTPASQESAHSAAAYVLFYQRSAD
jgi:ubiquitin carboxyl-terminal hydrolase 4/11/15